MSPYRKPAEPPKEYGNPVLVSRRVEGPDPLYETVIAIALAFSVLSVLVMLALAIWNPLPPP